MGKSFSVKVIEKVVVGAEEPWNDRWLPFTNLDVVLPTFDAASFFCYNKPSHGSSFPTMLNTLKASLSQALTLFYPLAGDIQWNAAAGENQIHCNNQGVDFTHAVADVQLKELDFYNPDESIEGKLVPKKLRGVLAVQVTELKCGGMVIGCMFEHKTADGYSANMFISAWADMARAKTPSMLPSFSRSVLKPRSPPTYSCSSVFEHIVATLEPSLMPDNDENQNDDDQLINRVYYMEGEQINKIQLLASENGSKRSKFEAFISFLWKAIGMSMEELGNEKERYCNVAIPVDGRRRLSEGDGEEKQKLMASHFGNVVTLPFGGKGSQMPLSNVATEVHELLHTVTGKDHFVDLIDWVEERRSHLLIPRAFVNKDMTVIVSSGQRFQFMNEMDFGWGKVAFGSCHIPPTRKDCYVMTLPGPITNNQDWVVYMHLPIKHINYIEAHASHVFKPVNADYLNI
ncbi:Chloramphenicol acetyltransferase-like domain-containing protein [Cynara cardunculus var. scolymus]|uniref:Chloramphenicol acetyltransferase-like domain-containing protein n=1 Tax=Cynara cardunculus var. scolymus TaxID=59895 RepID=A0A103XV62_CYNCS|nr:Chloramphenicol acetyltransferase-like domain-containing protein [Cynara cardunculus var. scolymus]